MEPVSEHYITDIKTTPDIDLNKVKVKVETDDNRYSDKFEVKVFEGCLLYTSNIPKMKLMHTRNILYLVMLKMDNI